MHEHKRALKDCMDELTEVASNIEGPLQEIIDDSARRIDKCMLKHGLHTSGTEGVTIEERTLAKEILDVIAWIIVHPIKLAINLIVTIIIAVIAAIIVNAIDTNAVLELFINGTK